MHAIRAALSAGEAIMEVYSNDFKVMQKEDHSPVTLADIKAQEAILPLLQSFGIPIISEEAELPDYDIRSSWEEFWLIDPLDGTKEFIHRNGEFTVNIALVRAGRPVMGVVFSPATDELFAGWVGEGVWNITSASRSIFDGISSLSGFELIVTASSARIHTVAISRSHSDQSTIQYLKKVKIEKGEISVIKAGSSMKFCLVAISKADEYPRFGPTREWDTAAGHAILLASGKDIYRVSDDSPLTYNQPELLNPAFIAR